MHICTLGFEGLEEDLISPQSLFSGHKNPCGIFCPWWLFVFWSVFVFKGQTQFTPSLVPMTHQSSLDCSARTHEEGINICQWMRNTQSMTSYSMLPFHDWKYNLSAAISRLVSTLSQWYILKPEKTKLPIFQLFKTQLEFSFCLSVSSIRPEEASTRTSNEKCPNKKINRPLIGSRVISLTTGCSPCLRLIIPLLSLWHEAARWGMNSCINLFFLVSILWFLLFLYLFCSVRWGLLHQENITVTTLRLQYGRFIHHKTGPGLRSDSLWALQRLISWFKCCIFFIFLDWPRSELRAKPS